MNILLIADLGSKNNFAYHVGDEAMFYETYRWYSNNKPNYNLSIFSNNRSHSKLKLDEFITPQIFKSKGLGYFLKLIIKFVIFKIFRIDRLSPIEKKTCYFLSKQDKIHFTGGGNISSIFKEQLLFYSFIILLTWLLKKEIILTSQTIGPFILKDLLLVFLVFNLPTKIGIREKFNVNKSLIQYSILLPKVYSMIDSAYTLDSKSQINLNERKSNVIRIGLSIHKWGSHTKQIEEALLESLAILCKMHKVQILLIPHVITNNKDKDDTYNMKQFISKIANTATIISFTNDKLLKTKNEPAINIKYLTENVDLLITTRYHGIIFALSSNTPCLTFKMDKYYNQKNSGALNHIYGKNIEKYVVDLQDKKNEKKLQTKIQYLINNNKVEKEILKVKNKQIFESINIQRRILFY